MFPQITRWNRDTCFEKRLIQLGCRALSGRVSGSPEQAEQPVEVAQTLEPSEPTWENRALLYLWIGAVVLMLGALGYLLWRGYTHAPCTISLAQPAKGWFEVWKFDEKGTSKKVGEGVIPGSLRIAAGDYEIRLEGGGSFAPVRESVSLKAGESVSVPDLDGLIAKANASGSPESERLLGFLYLYGWGVDIDFSEARHWLGKAASEGDVDAMVGAGDAYFISVQDIREGVDWYEKAANFRSSEGLERMGLMTRRQFGHDPSHRAELRWYEQSAELKNPHGEFHSGLVREKLGDYRAAMTFYLSVLSDSGKGDPVWAVAEIRIGELYDCGYGVQENHEEALSWFRKVLSDPYASNRVTAQAEYDIADLYQSNGITTAEDTKTLARTWYKKAADDGSVSACQALEQIYGTGDGVPKDQAESLRWNQKWLALNNDRSNFEREVELGF